MTTVAIAGAIGDRRATLAGGMLGRARERLAVMTAAFGVIAFACPVPVIQATLHTPEIGLLASAVREATQPRIARITWSSRGQSRSSPAPALTWASAVMLELEKRSVSFTTAGAPYLRWAIGDRRWEKEPSDTSVEVRFTTGTEREQGRLVKCVKSGENIFLKYPVCVWVMN